MKKSTNNYERPEVQVVHVETESAIAGSINSPANGYSWGEDDVENL